MTDGAGHRAAGASAPGGAPDDGRPARRQLLTLRFLDRPVLNFDHLDFALAR